jgi:hypothetical protein
MVSLVRAAIGFVVSMEYKVVGLKIVWSYWVIVPDMSRESVELGYIHVCCSITGRNTLADTMLPVIAEL